jgi:hypothetical protein
VTEPIAAAPAVAAPAPAAPGRNRLAVAGFVLVLVAVVLPVAGFVAGIIGAALEAPGGDDFGWAILGGLVFGGVGFGVAGPFALVGVVLCIVALTRRGRRKALAIVGLVLGTPLVFTGLLAATLALDVILDAVP